MHSFFFQVIYGHHPDVSFDELTLSVTTLFQGEQILTPINKCQVDVACLGNHDLVSYSFLMTFPSNLKLGFRFGQGLPAQLQM